MQSIREIAKRLRGIARAVEQQNRRRIGPLEHKTISADDDSIGAEVPAARGQFHESPKVNRAPHAKRDDECHGSGDEH